MGVTSLDWVTHGRLHTLPYDLGRPADFPRLYHYPGVIFLRDRSPREAPTPAPVLLHAYDATEDENLDEPIPFVQTSRAIDAHFLDRFVGKPPTELTKVLSDKHTGRRYQQASIAGHGSIKGKLPLGVRIGEKEGETSSLAWERWITQDLHVRHAGVWTCFLGRVEETRGEPLGWPAALRLTGTETLVGAVHNISDFWTPLLQLLYRQAQFLGKR